VDAESQVRKSRGGVDHGLYECRACSPGVVELVERVRSAATTVSGCGGVGQSGVQSDTITAKSLVHDTLHF
jgi:hypothetical protein